MFIPYFSVSIHAPWEGCDFSDGYDRSIELVFQFTHPGKGATEKEAPIISRLSHVSIHAPWEGCDKILARAKIASFTVSIHAPWEGCDLAFASE